MQVAASRGALYFIEEFNMTTLPAEIDAFLRSGTIAIAGVSRNPKEVPNLIYERLQQNGYPVIPVNPHMTSFHGSPCYPDLASIPDRPAAVFIATHPMVSPSIVRECGPLGIRNVWFHRSIGDGSWSREAADECRKAGIEAIEGGCPMMFVGDVDLGHACMRWIFQRTGKVPR